MIPVSGKLAPSHQAQRHGTLVMRAGGHPARIQASEQRAGGAQGCAFPAGPRFLGGGGGGGTVSSGSGLFGLDELGFRKSLETVSVQGHAHLAKCVFQFGRENGTKGIWTQRSPLKQHLDELSINKSETHGFHFL